MTKTQLSDYPIAIDGLEKRYEGTTAVHDLDLTVRENEIYGLIGANGAGKSTIINILVGSIHAEDGDVRIFGHDPIEDIVAAHRHVGVLPDRYGVYGALSAVDHIRYALEAKEIDEDPRKPLERVGLGSVVTEPAGSFSNGMQQRLALALALTGSPDLLLLDEPFSGLDPNGVRLVIDIVHECRRNGATVLLSSHDMARVNQLCDQIGIITDGTIRTEGTLSEVIDRSPIDTVLEATFAIPVTNANVRKFSTIEGVDVTGSGCRLSMRLHSPDARTAVDAQLESLDTAIESVVETDPTLEDAFIQYTTDTKDSAYDRNS